MFMRNQIGMISRFSLAAALALSAGLAAGACAGEGGEADGAAADAATAEAAQDAPDGEAIEGGFSVDTQKVDTGGPAPERIEEADEETPGGRW